MNSTMERCVQTCRRELIARTLIWNRAHLLSEFESTRNQHRPHLTVHSTAPLRPLPQPITERDRMVCPDVRRHDRLGSPFHEYTHAPWPART
ncbi:integrase [Streptomyces sp. NPDC059467]|uniref:integrase n=1 Tax=Streptomyces sp. NPDC059467 TaxID=3346844 RepID=UPI0036A141EF